MSDEGDDDFDREASYEGVFPMNLPPGLDGVEIIEIEMNPDIMKEMTVITKNAENEAVVRVFMSPNLTAAERKAILAKEIEHIQDRPFYAGDTSQQLDDFFKALEAPIRSETKEKPVLTLSGILIPEGRVPHGVLIKSVSVLWSDVVANIDVDWTRAFEIPPYVWEEIIAGAFHKDGYDKVTLTPRSGDHGRDVIAIKSGVGCVKIIGSVKAYKPDHLVKHDDVRALLGVLNGEQDASKGIITTTSGFAPKIATDPFIRPFLPTRLELLDGPKLKHWLSNLLKRH